MPLTKKTTSVSKPASVSKPVKKWTPNKPGAGFGYGPSRGPGRAQGGTFKNPKSGGR